MDADDVMLGQVVVQHVVAHMEHLFLQHRLQQAAIMEERVRFARDLHDGVLQSLTGTALQLQAVRRLLRDDPATAIERLDEIQHLIVAEQRDLRSYIRELKPAALLAGQVQAGLAPALRSLAARVERQWGLVVDLDLRGDTWDAGTGGLGHHVTHILHEALVNAARHGGASAARVHVEERGDHVAITVSDNGHGFPFRGRHDLGELAAMAAGPVSLRERVTALRGTLAVESSPAGAHIEITLPRPTHPV
jgi:signal transduction histidine kinase